LQDDRTKPVADKPAGSELTLLLVPANRRGQIAGIVSDGTHFPLAEFLGRRQIDVDEGLRAIRYLVELDTQMTFAALGSTR
jgi:hypothetical protein